MTLHTSTRYPPGTFNAYVNDRCRCPACTAANTKRGRELRRAKATGTYTPTYLDPTEARRLLDSLRRQGWTVPQLARVLRIAAANLWSVYERPRIHTAKLERIRDMHSRLVDQPAPATRRNHAKRAATYAGRRGAVHANAWFDIANANEKADRPRAGHNLPALRNPVTEYRGMQLKTQRYSANASVAGIPDDGHLDEIAIERVLHGQRNGARLTAREVVCIVYRAARAGMSDHEVSLLFGPDVITYHGVRQIRSRNGIPSRYEEMQSMALAAA